MKHLYPTIFLTPMHKINYNQPFFVRRKIPGKYIKSKRPLKTMAFYKIIFKKYLKSNINIQGFDSN